MTPAQKERDKRAWIAARRGQGASDDMLERMYTLITEKRLPPPTERQRRVLTEKELALQRRS